MVKKFDKNNSYALLVGVGKRKEDSENMKITAEDAKYLKIALAKALKLFKENNIIQLINKNARKKSIITELESWVKKTAKKPADLFIVYFSGHGSKIDDKYYLICNDTTNEDLDNSGLAGDDFVARLKSIQCNKMLVLLDCCHAEGMSVTHIPFDEKSFEEIKNRVILTACAKDQVSYLSKPVSIFTYVLIEGLGGKLLNNNSKEVNLFNLAMSVRERVVALSKNIDSENPQQPQLNVLEKSGTTNFVLAIYPKSGPRPVNFLREELSSLKSFDGKKEIDIDVKSLEHEDYRKKFNWLKLSVGK